MGRLFLISLDLTPFLMLGLGWIAYVRVRRRFRKPAPSGPQDLNKDTNT